MSRLEEIEARLENTTPGPWESGDHYSICGVMKQFGEGKCVACSREGAPIWEGRRDINGTVMQAHVHIREIHDSFRHGVVHYTGDGDVWHVVIETDEYGLMSQADRDFVAHAREDIPYLLAEIAQLSAPLDRGLTREWLDELIAEIDPADYEENFGGTLFESGSKAMRLLANAILSTPPVVREEKE
jgi:hypothetical protein